MRYMRGAMQVHKIGMRTGHNQKERIKMWASSQQNCFGKKNHIAVMNLAVLSFDFKKFTSVSHKH